MVFEVITAIAASIAAGAAVVGVIMKRREKKPLILITLRKEGGADYYLNIRPDKLVPRCRVFLDGTQLVVRGSNLNEIHIYLGQSMNFNTTSEILEGNKQILVYSGDDVIHRTRVDKILKELT